MESPDMPGRFKLLWNTVLDARGQTSQRSDEDLAAAEVDGEVLGVIDRRDWYQMMVWCPSLMVEVLEAAESAGAQGVEGRLARARESQMFHRGPPDHLAA